MVIPPPNANTGLICSLFPVNSNVNNNDLCRKLWIFKMETWLRKSLSTFVPPQEFYICYHLQVVKLMRSWLAAELRCWPICFEGISRWLFLAFSWSALRASHFGWIGLGWSGPRACGLYCRIWLCFFKYFSKNTIKFYYELLGCFYQVSVQFLCPPLFVLHVS